MDWLYETRCDRCDGRATTAYTVYSYVFRCPRCLEKVPLFDCVEVSRGAGEKIIRACPHCHARGIVEEISTRVERFESIPVLVSYECQEGCRPKRGERHHNDPDPKKRALFEEYDLGKLREIAQRQPPYWYPTSRMLNAPVGQERWGLLWRPYHAGVETVADFYTPRNLYASALLSDKIRHLPSKVLDPLEFAFTSILLKCSKMMAHNSDGIGRIQKGTLYIPAVIHDVNVLMFMAEAVGDMCRGYEEILPPSTDLIISTDDARQLDLPANSIDYAFTDPPYSWKVQFGESNFIWEAWLRFDSSWLPNEIIVNEIRQKADLDWERDMQRAMSECFRVLKPGRWLSLCYHDTSEGTWQLLQDLMTSIGFIPDTIDETLYIDASQKSIKQITANQVTKRDLVINFRKPRLGEVAPALAITGDEDATTFAEKARVILADALERHPGASADRLYDELVSRMVRRGEFERHNFEALLAQVAEPVREPVMRNLLDPTPPDLPVGGGHEVVRWYLKERADHLDEAESRKEAAAAARLEKFMVAALTPGPSLPPRRGALPSLGEGR